MKFLVLILSLTSIAKAFDTFESERYLYAYMRFTKEVKRISSNIPLNQNDPKIIQDLKFELKSCGISSTENSCLDSKFTSQKALETFIDENQEGTRFLIKGFSQDLFGQSFIIQVMTIHAEFDQVQVDKVEFFEEVIPLTNDGFRSFFEKYLQHQVKKVFETSEFFSHDISHYFEAAKNSMDSLEIYHSITLAKSLDLDGQNTLEIENILRDKFEIILSTKSPLYQIEYLKLFENIEDLKKQLAEKFFQSSDSKTREKSAIILANLGVNEPNIKSTVISVVKTGINYHDQLDALDGLFKIKNSLEDDILVLQSIKNGNPDVSRKAYELSSKLNFNEDHLNYLSGELKNPNSDYRVFMLDFIGKVNSKKSTEIILNSLDDITEPVTKKAFSILKDRELDYSDYSKIKRFLRTLKDFTKFYCLQLLDKDKSEEISELLIDHLTDISPKVEELSVHLLLGRELTPKIKKEIWKLVRKKKTKVYSLRILSKLPTNDVTSLLINELTEIDHKDLGGLYELIKTRELDFSYYETIKDIYRNSEPKIRTIGIKLLAKYPEMKTLEFLRSILISESEKSVKGTIELLIKYLEDKLIPKPVVVDPVPPPVVDPGTIQPPTTSEPTPPSPPVVEPGTVQPPTSPDPTPPTVETNTGPPPEQPNPPTPAVVP